MGNFIDMEKEQLIIPLSVIITGRICSGKSTVSTRLAERFDCQVISFGQYIDSYCREHGIDPNRVNKQNIGTQLIQSGTDDFVANVVKYFLGDNLSSKIIIFEGVRHLGIYESIKKRSSKLFTFFLNPDQDILFKRYINRENLSNSITLKEMFVDTLKHPVESEIMQISKFADLIFSNEDIDIIDNAVSIFIEQKLLSD